MEHDRGFSRRFALAAAALLLATTGYTTRGSSAAAPASDATSTQPPSSGQATSKTPNDRESVRPDEPYQPPADLTRLKWTGDLDGMIRRRLVRVLTISSKTTFFVDNGTPRGLVYEAFRQYEDDLNKRLGNKNVEVHVVVIPVANDDLIPALPRDAGTSWRRRSSPPTGAVRWSTSRIRR